jgi:hypothetical protein
MGYATFKEVPSSQLGQVGQVRAEAPGYTSVDTYALLGKGQSIALVRERADSTASQLPYTVVFRSGALPSGSGSNYSQWYELAAVPPKPGFVIDSKQSSFELVGDRKCNAWSECALGESTDISLIWHFRMQGHNESNSNSGVTYSEGILKVTYVPQGQKPF